MKKLSKKTAIVLASILAMVLFAGGTVGGMYIWYKEDLVIYNLGIDIDSDSIYEFFGFGSMLDYDKMNSCFEYRLDPDADVYSPCNGVIKRIEYQPETDDYSILIVPKKHFMGNNYKVDMDHVTKLPSGIKKGAKVTAGQVIGKPGPWDGLDSVGRVEIDITHNEVHYPAFKFFDPATIAEYEDKIKQLIDDLEMRVGNPNLFDGYGTIYAGVWVDKIPESYYSGR